MPTTDRSSSSTIYALIAKHWPIIAAICLVALGMLGFIVGGLTSDSNLELYLMAWSGIAGGLWFLFDIAEKSYNLESKARLST